MSGRNYLESHSRLYTYTNRRCYCLSRCSLLGLYDSVASLGTFFKVFVSRDIHEYPVNEELRRKGNLIIKFN